MEVVTTILGGIVIAVISGGFVKAINGKNSKTKVSNSQCEERRAHFTEVIDLRFNTMEGHLKDIKQAVKQLNGENP